MAITGSVQLAAEVKPLYDGDFLMACQGRDYWDQFADLRKQMNGERGNTYNFPIVESLQPQTSVLDELADVTPQRLNANEVSVTLREYGGAVELTKYVDATSYSDPLRQAAYANGYCLAESIDLIARAVYGQGGRQFFQNGRTARSQFAGQSTAADRVTYNFFTRLGMLTKTIFMPLYDDGMVMTVVHPFVKYDLLLDTTVQGVANRLTPEMLFNGEVACLSGIRIVETPNAKSFWGAGATAVSSAVTTLATAAAPGDTSIVVAANTNIAVGNILAIIDAAETGNTWSDTNEAFVVTGINSTTISGYALTPGPGDGGGLRYAHASGITVNNNNSVYPIVCFGPDSVTKVCSDYTGPYGETVVTGPFDRLGRFINLGFYALLGYARTRTGWIARGEVGSSQS